ncbi:MAG: LURP-one-related family protein [Promethearchaeia archaeon]
MTPKFCPKCGTELTDASQKVCESCGAELPESEGTSSGGENQSQAIQEEAPNPPSQEAGLFDIERNYYILKEKYWDWGSGDILDQENQVIGKMKRKLLSLRKKIELKERDGSVAATIHKKFLSLRGAHDLKTPDGELIARIKKKFLSFFRPKFFLEDSEGNRWFEAQGKFMGFSFKITDVTTGELVAEVEKADAFRDVFLGGLLDFKDTYALRILDNETDRRILLGFVITIDNVIHDDSSGGFLSSLT